MLPDNTIDVRHANVLFSNWHATTKANPDRGVFPTMNALKSTRAMTLAQFASSTQQVNTPNDTRTDETDDIDVDFQTNDTEFDSTPPVYDDGMRRDPMAEQVIRNQVNQGSFNRNLASLSSRIRYSDVLALRACTLSTIMKYRGTPLALFDDIMDVMEYFAFERNLDFQQRALYQGRTTLLKHLKAIHGMQNFQAKLVNVPISKGRTAGVVVFDTIEVITHFFSDKRLFCKSNIAEGYDFWTGLTKESEVYGEVHTGTKWKEARDHYVGETGQVPLGLIGFYDKTTTDGKNDNSTAPFMITLTCFNQNTRRKAYATFPIGLVPNLKYGLSSDEGVSPAESLTDEHECLFAILNQLIDIEKQGGVKMNIAGREVIGRPWIHFIIGDIEGNNRLVGAFQDNSGRTCRPNRMCKCPGFISDTYECEWVEMSEFIAAKEQYKILASSRRKGEADKLMKKISRHNIRTVWERGVPLSDRIYGINILCPPEMLHTFGVGICKYLLAIIHSKLSKEDSRNMDRIHAEIYTRLKRNCDRDYYESSLHKGATETVKQGALENIGNLLAVMCISRTVHGHELLTRNALTDDERDFAHPIIMLMSYIGWMHNDNPKDEVHRAKGFIADIMADIAAFFPRDEGQGWDIPKYKGAIQMVQCIEWFGNAAGFYGGHGEHSHITYVKDNARRTQKRAPTFLEQMSERIHEQAIVDKADETLIHQFRDDIREHFPNSSSICQKLNQWEDVELETNKKTLRSNNEPCQMIRRPTGKVTVTASWGETTTPFGLATPTYEWSNSRHNRSKRKLCFEVHLYFSNMAQSRWKWSYKHICYTSVTIQFPKLPNSSIIRCTESYDKEEWYDFVAFRDGESVRPGKVCGIYEFGSEIRLIVHTTEATDTPFNFVDSLNQEFLVSFELGGTNRILEVKLADLVEPLIVFPNFGGNEKSQHMCLLPKRRWAHYFSTFLRNSKWYT